METPIVLLKAKQAFTGDPNETRFITVEIAKLEAERAMIASQRLAFLAEQTAIRPPSQGQVDKVIQLAKNLDEMTANATAAQGIVTAATDAINTWAATQV